MIEALFDRSVTVNRWSPRTLNSEFEFEAAFVEHATGVDCCIQHKMPGTMMTAAGKQVPYDGVGYFAFGIDVLEGDQLVDGADVWTVHGIGDQTGRGEFLKAKMKKA